MNKSVKKNIEKCLEQNMSNYGSSWNSTLLGEVKRPKSVHHILSITRANAVANVRVLPGEYFILRWVQYTGYFITGEDYQCDDM